MSYPRPQHLLYMFETIYVEESIRQHPRTRQICRRFARAQQIICQRYGEVFNPKAQNFRLQKQRPALILAEKHEHYVHKAPPGYGIGASKNYYFSHMLNCLYDCRYCFLQGMMQSANYILFVNYEDFGLAIENHSNEHPGQPVHFFSGYDCDSLALEPVTGFAAHFLPFFADLDNAWLELRTKSTQIRSLLETRVIPRCIVAFSFTPETVAAAVEHKAPNVQRRIEAMLRLQQQGWLLGLRFDPIIYQVGYQQLFECIFRHLDLQRLHSVSLGVFRLPENYYKKIHRLYPREKLFAGPLQSSAGVVSYPDVLEQEMMHDCRELLLQYIPEDRFFPCQL